MEVAVERPPPVKDEKRDGNSAIGTLGNAAPVVLESFPKLPSPTTQIRDPNVCKQEERLESTKAEMGEVREENERLKALLAHIIRDYQSLQMHFLNVVKKEEEKKAVPPVVEAAAAATSDMNADHDQSPLFSLSLGSSSGGGGHKKEGIWSSERRETLDDESLSLGLGCKLDRSSWSSKVETTQLPLLNLSSDSSPEEPKEDAGKATKNLSNGGGGGGGGGDGEVSQMAPAKKARVSVRAKCDTPTMNDGCQWRKYGQKISKGNPCPRAYYRCTVAPACPVRKQVQRCAEDMSILITTYEGTHNHPLPASAAAMASTTAAAASMLTSGSTSSHHHLSLMSPAAASSATFFRGGALLGPTTVSAATACPTITLDLTAPHPLLPSYTSTSYGLSSSSSGYVGYGSHAYYAKNSPSPLGHGLGMGMARPGHEQLYGLQRAGGGGGGAMTDTIAKAITADPSFQSVLAAAITSYMGCGGAAAADQR